MHNIDLDLIKNSPPAPLVIPSSNPISNEKHELLTKSVSHDDRFHCDFPNCNKNYPKRFTLNRHKKTHNEAKLCCDVPSCGKKFYENSALERHKRMHNPLHASKNISRRKRKLSPTSQEVSHTNKKHNAETDSNSHIIPTELARPIETSLSCSTTTTTSEEFKNLSSAPIFDRTAELPVIPPNPIPQVSISPIASKTPTTKSISHDGKFHCDFPNCNKKFPKNFTLNRHKKRHGDKKFCCDVSDCGKKFYEKSDLKRHKTIHNRHILTELTRPIETPQLCSTTTTTSAEIKNLSSAPILERTPEFPVIPLNPIPEVTPNLQEVKPTESSSSRAKPIQKNKIRKKRALRSPTELASLSNTRDAMILLITTAVKPIISLMVYTPFLSPELREKQISSGSDSIKNMIILLLSRVFSNQKQLETQGSIITDAIRNLLFKILLTPSIPEKWEFQIAEVMDLLQKKLAEMSFVQPSTQERIDLTSDDSGGILPHTPASGNPIPSKNLDSKSSPAGFSGSSQHQRMESSVLPTHTPEKTTDTSSPSRNSSALFGVDQSLHTERQVAQILSEIRTQYSHRE
jgi:hypothetical protein